MLCPLVFLYAYLDIISDWNEQHSLYIKCWARVHVIIIIWIYVISCFFVFLLFFFQYFVYKYKQQTINKELDYMFSNEFFLTCSKTSDTMGVVTGMEWGWASKVRFLLCDIVILHIVGLNVCLFYVECEGIVSLQGPSVGLINNSLQVDKWGKLYRRKSFLLHA